MIKMSNRVAIKPEWLRDTARGIRNVNNRNTEQIKTAINNINRQNEEIASEKSVRETRLCDQMFTQIGMAGIDDLIASFNNSYNRQNERTPILERACGYTLPSSMTDVFLRNLHQPGVTKNNIRFFVEGTEWGQTEHPFRSSYNKMVSAIRTVPKEVNRQLGILQGFTHRGATPRHHATSRGIADDVFVSRLNRAGDAATEVFIGVNARSREADGIVSGSRDGLDNIQRNIEIIGAHGAEIADQTESFAAEKEALDQQAAGVLSGQSRMIPHHSQLIRSQVELTLHRSDLLSDGRGLVNARSDQREDRNRNLASSLTTNIFEPAEFVARPMGNQRTNVATLCEDAMREVDSFLMFSGRRVSIEIRDEATGQWGPRQSLGRSLGSYLSREMMEDIARARRVS